MSHLAEREAALLELARRVVERARPGENLEAFASHGIGASVRVFEREVERLTNAESRGLGLRVVVDGRLGFAATSDLSEAGLAYVLEEARSNATHGTPDVGNVLPDAPAEPPAPIPALIAPSLLEVPPERKVALALEVERLATGLDPRVSRVEAAGYGDSVTSVAIASTTGMASTYSRTDAMTYVTAMARDGDETQTAVGFSDGRSVDDLDLEAAAGEAVSRAVRLLGARKPATATVPVVFDPMVTAEFLGVLAGMFSAEAVQKGRSLLAGRLGEQVANDRLTLVDDGRVPGGPAAAPFDDEGVPTGRTTLVDGGVLRDYLRHTTAAARDGNGARSTGNAHRGSYGSTPGIAPTNLFFEGDRTPAADVLGMAGDGLYVQSVSGVHSGVHAISGEFSVGATGLWIRGGELAEPVRELTVSSTILDMLRGVRALGDDQRYFSFAGAYAGCTLLLDAMTVAGS